MAGVRITKPVVTSAIVLCVAVMIATHGCQRADQTGGGKDTSSKASIADVIKANSEVIDELGKSAAVMMESSDIIMRYSHYTNDHSTPVLFCPECFPDRPKEDETEFDDPEVDVPETMDQLLKDSREQSLSVGSLTSSLRLQQAALKYHLEKLRSAAGGKTPSTDNFPESPQGGQSDGEASPDTQNN